MADEQDRIRTLRRLAAAQNPTPVTAPTPLAPSSPASFRRAEEASMAALEAQTPVSAAESATLENKPGTPLTGAQRAANAKTQREQRFAEELAAREASKPTEDPGPGNIWSYNVAEGRWKKVFVGGGFGGTAGAGANTGAGGAGTGGAGTGESGSTTTYTAPDGKIFTDLGAYNAYIAQQKANEKRIAGQSAYDLLFEQFNQYGLGGLVEPLKGFITEGLSKAEFTLRLRDTDAYKKRFAANQARIQKGLSALSEAEYINLEDQYQDVMRRYGLPESYYSRGDMGRQEGFEKFIGGDVSPVELEDRIQTAQRRVINAAPQIKDAISQFYGDEISNGDILAYVLDPSKAIEGIKRKVTAAEIGAGAALAGLGTTRTRAEELGALGVTSQQAREGFQAIGGFLPRASQLGDIYGKQGMGPYTQTTAEAEVFGTAGAVDAERKRRQLAQLETAQFSGQVGAAGGALGRERAGQF